jgi:hypothetical protein
MGLNPIFRAVALPVARQLLRDHNLVAFGDDVLDSCSRTVGFFRFDFTQTAGEKAWRAPFPEEPALDGRAGNAQPMLPLRDLNIRKAFNGGGDTASVKPAPAASLEAHPRRAPGIQARSCGPRNRHLCD